MRWTLLAVSLLAVTASAAGPPANPAAGRPAGPPGPAVLDADGDGLVSRAEAETFPRLAGRFDAADTNRDGQLDAAELDAHRAQMRGDRRAQADARWKAADTDGDGALSRAEAEQSLPGVAMRFDEVDADRDGRVTRAEMHDYRMRGNRGR